MTPILLLCALALGMPAPDPAQSVVQVREEVPNGEPFHQGSGVVVAPGVVATNAHVVASARPVRIVKDGRSWRVTSFCVEAARDLCLLKVPDLDLPVASLGLGQPPAPGAPVLSIGYPRGQGPMTRAGLLQAVWHFRGDTLLQSDALTLPGSSGGGLFSADGQLLGITTFVLSAQRGIGFAIPIAWIQGLLADDMGSSHLRCPDQVKADYLLDFLDDMSSDPENGPAWAALAAAWVRDAPQDAEAWYAQGIALEHQAQPDQVGQDPGQNEEISAFRQAVRLRPGYARAWNNLGVALQHQNQSAAAAAALERAVQLEPDYALAYLNLGAIHLENRSFASACAALARGLALRPDDSVGWGRLGYCQFALGKWREAAHSYQVALGLSPFRAEWWGERMLACRRCGDQPGAQAAMERLRNLDPGLAKQLARSR